jgi:hypothetical protein
MGVMMGRRSHGKNPIIPVTATDGFARLQTAEFTNLAVRHPCIEPECGKSARFY